MNTIAISEGDFLQLRTEVSELKKRLLALEAAAAAKPAKKTRTAAKRNGAVGAQKTGSAPVPEKPIPAVLGLPIERIPLKRGAGKHLVTYMADDFTAPLDDLKEYMQ